MYTHILIPLENSATDDIILDHIRLLARTTKAKLTLVHCADGFQARHQKRLGESEEMRRDKIYLQRHEDDLKTEGFDTNSILTWGDPAEKILEIAEQEGCDLIAMATHGHKFFCDLLFGSVASDVHHRSKIPVLLVRAQK